MECAKVFLFHPTLHRTPSVPNLHSIVLKAYRTKNCLAMSKLFKYDPMRVKHQVRHPFMCTHVLGSEYQPFMKVTCPDVELDDVHNILPLFKHIELEWDRGNIALVLC